MQNNQNDSRLENTNKTCKQAPRFSEQQIQTESFKLLARLSQSIPDYKARDGQKQMIASVARAFNGDNTLVIEAGTGTGKTFSYLLGALPLILEAKKRLIVATYTVSLQTQLMKKDIPLIQAIAEKALKIEVAKGGEHYFCIKRTKDLINSKSLDLQTEFAELATTKVSNENIQQAEALLQRFSQNQFDGDLDTLSSNQEKSIIPLVQRRKDRCPKKARCEHGETCPYYEQRKKVIDADIVVTNHALLSITCKNEASILGELNNALLVVDEAHHFPDVFRDQSEVAIELDEKEFPAKKINDLIDHLAKFFVKNKMENFSQADAQKASLDFAKVRNLTHDFMEKLLELEQFLLHNFIRLRGEKKDRYEDENLWLLGFEPSPKPLNLLLQDLLKMSTALYDLVIKIQAKMIEAFLKEKNLLPKQKNKLSSIDMICEQILEELSTLVACCKNYIENDEIQVLRDRVNAGYVRWIRLDGSKNNSTKFVISSNRSDIRTNLKHKIFDLFSSCVFTSATIRALGSFDQFNKKMGIGDFIQAKSELVPSPFDYSKVGFSAPIKFGDPKTQNYSQLIANQLQQASLRHQAILMIFNSYQQLNFVYDKLPAFLQKNVIKQKKQAMGELVDYHCKQIDAGKQSILFGVDSLAEGIDLKGRYLTCVMIAKFPFPTLSDPMFNYDAKKIDFFKGSSFFELSLPLCSRKLIQCVGRLIRSESDYGEIILLDSRYHTKPKYGRKLVEALPINTQSI